LVDKRDLDKVNAREDIFSSSSSVKVPLLRLLLVINFNLHLFILLYSDVDLISMSVPCTCVSTVLVTDFCKIIFGNCNLLVA
jgi:hypothetical protein